MRYKIMRRMGDNGYQEFCQANWLADACWIVNSLAATSPVHFDIFDTSLEKTYSHEWALQHHGWNSSHGRVHGYVAS